MMESDGRYSTKYANDESGRFSLKGNGELPPQLSQEETNVPRSAIEFVTV